MRTAIYIRVSTKKQVEEGYSLDAQREKLVNLCKNNNDLIYKIYADEGKSGKDTEHRPAFNEMMSDMKDNKFDKIIVMKLDRISRSVVDLELMIRNMQEYGVAFESASEKIDTSSSMGMMFVRLLGVFAQFERERIKERINDTFDTMIKDGKVLSGIAPFGYRKTNDNKLEIDPEVEPVVRYFYKSFEETNSINKSIIRTNNHFGIVRYREGYRKLITSTYYYGGLKGNNNYCPAYISKEKWDEYNKILKNRNVKIINGGNEYIFSSLLKCTCGHTLAGKTQRGKYHSYHCSYSSLKLKCDKTKYIGELKFEKFLVDNIDLYISNYCDKIELEYKKTSYKEVDNTSKINKIKEEMKRTTISFNKGRMSEEDYDNEYSILEGKLKALEGKKTIKKDISGLKTLQMSNWKELYYTLSIESKRSFWREFIDYIEIDLDHKYNENYTHIYFK